MPKEASEVVPLPFPVVHEAAVLMGEIGGDGPVVVGVPLAIAGQCLAFVSAETPVR